MSTIFRDKFEVDGHSYDIDACPLDTWLAAQPERPATSPTPWRRNGYVATWAVVGGAVYLIQISMEAIGKLYARQHGAEPATWFSGIVHGWRGERRRTGDPSRTFHDDEIVLEIVSGVVTRAWQLDLRAVPDETDEELRRSLPAFLWPARLRGED